MFPADPRERYSQGYDFDNYTSSRMIPTDARSYLHYQPNIKNEVALQQYEPRDIISTHGEESSSGSISDTQIRSDLKYHRQSSQTINKYARQETSRSIDIVNMSRQLRSEVQLHYDLRNRKMDQHQYPMRQSMLPARYSMDNQRMCNDSSIPPPPHVKSREYDREVTCGALAGPHTQGKA